MTALDAITKALEASIALHQDEVTGQPDWSINPQKFWMTLSDSGYEVVQRPTPAMLKAETIRNLSGGAHIDGSSAGVSAFNAAELQRPGSTGRPALNDGTDDV